MERVAGRVVVLAHLGGDIAEVGADACRPQVGRLHHVRIGRDDDSFHNGLLGLLRLVARASWRVYRLHRAKSRRARSRHGACGPDRRPGTGRLEHVDPRRVRRRRRDLTPAAPPAVGDLARHPTFLPPYMTWAKAITLHGVLDRRANALLALRTGYLCGSEFEWGVHAQTAQPRRRVEPRRGGSRRGRPRRRRMGAGRPRPPAAPPTTCTGITRSAMRRGARCATSTPTTTARCSRSRSSAGTTRCCRWSRTPSASRPKRSGNRCRRRIPNEEQHADEHE